MVGAYSTQRTDECTHNFSKNPKRDLGFAGSKMVKVILRKQGKGCGKSYFC
jgi:hypothetical protein